MGEHYPLRDLGDAFADFTTAIYDAGSTTIRTYKEYIENMRGCGGDIDGYTDRLWHAGAGIFFCTLSLLLFLL